MPCLGGQLTSLLTPQSTHLRLLHSADGAQTVVLLARPRWQVRALPGAETGRNDIPSGRLNLLRIRRRGSSGRCTCQSRDRTGRSFAGTGADLRRNLGQRGASRDGGGFRHGGSVGGLSAEG